MTMPSPTICTSAARRGGKREQKSAAPSGGAFASALAYSSPWAGWNTRAAMSFSRASDAPPSTVRLYASPGATSFQMMQPVPPSSQRRDAAHQRTCRLLAAGVPGDVGDALRHVHRGHHAVTPRLPVFAERHLRHRLTVQLEQVVAQHRRALRRGGDGVGLGADHGKGRHQRFTVVVGGAVPLDAAALAVPAHRAVVVHQQRQAAHLPAHAGQRAVRGGQGRGGVDRAVAVIQAVYLHRAGRGGDSTALVPPQVVVRQLRRVFRQRQRGAQLLCLGCGAEGGEGRAAVVVRRVFGGGVSAPRLPQGQGQRRCTQAGRQRAPAPSGGGMGQGALGFR